MTASIPSLETKESSVSILAELAMRHSGAEGYALYALDTESGALLLKHSAGASLPRPQDLTISRGLARRRGSVVVSYPLRLEGSLLGTLAFAFQGDSVAEQRISILDRLAGAVEIVYCLPHSATRLFEKINRMEAEVAASKIAVRAQGLLRGASLNEALERIDLIEQHVAHTMRSWSLTPLLQDLLQKAEAKVSERRLTSQAKSLIQDAYGLSEEQAYAHLRNISRRTRRTLGEVAREFIAEAAGAQLPHLPSRP
jgi:ANTAR domain